MNSRNKILWFGNTPPIQLQDEFSNRSLVLQKVDPESLAAFERLDSVLTSQIRGIVIEHDPARLSRTRNLLLNQIRNEQLKYLNIRTVVLVPDPQDVLNIRYDAHNNDLFSGNSKSPARQTFLFQDSSAIQPGKFAQQFAGHESRAPNLELDIQPDDEELLTEPFKVLLRRAFNDCDAIIIRKMSQGRSASIVTVFPNYQGAPKDSHSLPFIAKFDDVENIQSELNYYTDYVFRDIPFNLRPSVDPRRCFTDCDKGIIVANLVDRSIPLLDAIKSGSGPHALHSLFEDALANWLHNAIPVTGHPYSALQPIELESADVEAAERNRFRKRKFDPAVLLQAKRSYGSVLEPHEILERVKNNISCEEYLSGTAHRDLHTKNILVKGYDSIVIDFAKTDQGPILLDSATLDVSIAFDSVPREINQQEHDENPAMGTKEHDKKFNEWEIFVKEIFELEEVLNIPSPRRGHELYARESACIRQIRRHALSAQKSKNEYAICVAVELMRCSTLTSKTIRVRSLAYYLANRLVNSLI